MGKVIALFNQKGGVGKTTTNVNLSACIAIKGRKMLIIDIDPQGNTTSGFGIDKNSTEFNIYDALLGDEDIRNCIVKTKYENIDIVPSNVQLAGAEIELTELSEREYRFKKMIQGIKDGYDYVFVDCPLILKTPQPAHHRLQLP